MIGFGSDHVSGFQGVEERFVYSGNFIERIMDTWSFRATSNLYSFSQSSRGSFEKESRMGRAAKEVAKFDFLKIRKDGTVIELVLEYQSSRNDESEACGFHPDERHPYFTYSLCSWRGRPKEEWNRTAFPAFASVTRKVSRFVAPTFGHTHPHLCGDF